MVEEVEDLKCMVTDLKAEMSQVRGDVVDLQKQLEHSKAMIGLVRNGCCSIL